MVLSPQLRAVVFDHHQTLFQAEDDSAWVRAGASRLGRDVSRAAVADLTTRVKVARTRPDVLERQRGRDCSPEAHRAATTYWLRQAGLDGALVDALYERLQEPSAWWPYADTARVLEALRARSIPVAVLSNTGWDIRPTFECHGVRGLVSTFVLSCEHGRAKPDPELFRLACAQLGISPRAALMVGDDPMSDGGAVRVGMPVLLLPPDAPPQSTRGLDAVLRLVGSPAGPE